LTELPELDQRPIIVAIAGPNGAGKTTFAKAHLADAGLRIIETDALAEELGLEPYVAAKIADELRRKFVLTRESFVFETVFSDPVGDKLDFLKDAAANGYVVVLCFIGLANSELSENRVEMRVQKGGHDVPTEKLRSRFPRTLANLKAALRVLPIVYVFDNGDLGRGFRKVAVFRRGQQVFSDKAPPEWFRALLE
jgi:predicted ABC-type ATPase